jgi:hypothetical protein
MNTLAQAFHAALAGFQHCPAEAEPALAHLAASFAACPHPSTTVALLRAEDMTEAHRALCAALEDYGLCVRFTRHCRDRYAYVSLHRMPPTPTPYEGAEVAAVPARWEEAA